MPEKMDEEQLVHLVEREFENSVGAPGTEIATERAAALDFYLSKKYGTEKDGQSQVVTADVSEVVDAIMPQLLRIFTPSDNLVSFDAVGPGDEGQAEQESDRVSYEFFKKNPAFLIQYQWIFDALVSKNGYVKAYWHEREEIDEEIYENLTQPELGALDQDDEIEIIEKDERLEDLGGVLVPIFDVKVRRITKDGFVKCENVAPEEMRVSSDAKSLDLSEARMVGHERSMTRSDLLEIGFDPSIVDDLPAESVDIATDEITSRLDHDDETRDSENGDRSQDLILVKEAYMKVDYDGDGRSERRKITIAGGKILENIVVDRQPFHVLCSKPLPHKHFGRCVAEMVMDIQLLTSTLWRLTLDNLYQVGRPGHMINEDMMTGETMQQLLSVHAGRYVGVEGAPTEAHKELTTEFTAGASFPMLQELDKAKRERTGVAAESEGLSPESLKEVRTGALNAAIDMSRSKIEAIARIFGETGYTTLFLDIRRLLQKHQKKQEVIALRGEWVPVDPQEWRRRYNTTVNIGLGIGTREQNLQHLNAIFEVQKVFASSEDFREMVSPDNAFNTVSEMVKNANLKDPERYFTRIDPQQQQQAEDPTAQLAAQQAQLAQAALQVEQQKVQISEMQLAHKQEMDRAKLLLDQEKERNRFHQAEEDRTLAYTQAELQHATDIPGQGQGA